jgi:hypothetical protein
MSMASTTTTRWPLTGKAALVGNRSGTSIVVYSSFRFLKIKIGEK